MLTGAEGEGGEGRWEPLTEELCTPIQREVGAPTSEPGDRDAQAGHGPRGAQTHGLQAEVNGQECHPRKSYSHLKVALLSTCRVWSPSVGYRVTILLFYNHGHTHLQHHPSLEST